jgi:16S rRNA (guanine(1405)-N(7))-methyltransferase
MPLREGFRYRAIDVDGRLVELLANYLARFPAKCEAGTDDLVAGRSVIEADLVLLLKSIPCLERQESGAGVRLLDRVRARSVAVSFPAKSLGGRAKGMRENYERTWRPRFEEMGYAVMRFAYAAETVYVLNRP